jgi:23S rRNA pseudouridine1911/1915/1917 synthase
MNRRVSFDVRPADAGERLDVVLARRIDRSRTACVSMIKRGLVRVDGRSAKAARLVAAGEHVDADVPAPVKPSAVAEEIPISIVYEDRDLCVVDKPAGMATHPAPGSARGTLVNALLAKLGRLPSINGVLRPGIVHRLDKQTSGLLVVAKSDRAMRGLSEAIAARTVQRGYDAVVWGVPANRSGTIDAPIARDAAVRTRFAVRPQGRRAVTHYRVRERLGSGDVKTALLELQLETGRTHQIRVHCAAIGHPIVGDPTYGAGRPRLGVTRQMLHAARLSFDHPVTGKPLAFESEWPGDFAGLVERLRRGDASG